MKIGEKHFMQMLSRMKAGEKSFFFNNVHLIKKTMICESSCEWYIEFWSNLAIVIFEIHLHYFTRYSSESQRIVAMQVEFGFDLKINGLLRI